MQRLLDGIESVGNKVPHPAIMFLDLIASRRRALDGPGRVRRRRHRDVAVQVPPLVAEQEYVGGSIVPEDNVTAG